MLARASPNCVEQVSAVLVVDVAVPGGVVALERGVLVGQQRHVVARQRLSGAERGFIFGEQQQRSRVRADPDKTNTGTPATGRCGSTRSVQRAIRWCSHRRQPAGAALVAETRMTYVGSMWLSAHRWGRSPRLRPGWWRCSKTSTNSRCSTTTSMAAVLMDTDDVTCDLFLAESTNDVVRVEYRPAATDDRPDAPGQGGQAR